MFEAGGVVAVLGIGVGWALTDLPQLRRGLPWWSGIPVVVVLIASLGPGALARVRTEHVDLRHERGRNDQIALLQTTIDTLGGHRLIDGCGEPVTILEYRREDGAAVAHSSSGAGGAGSQPSPKRHLTVSLAEA